MNSKLTLTSIVIFSVIIGISSITQAMATPPEEFKVSIPLGTGSLGCEETNECYIPAYVVVNVGDIVTWSNDDSLGQHTVTSGIPGAHDEKFDSGLLFTGETYSYVFNAAGQFDYHCHIHPWMTGVVHVTPKTISDSKVECVGILASTAATPNDRRRGY